MTSPIFIFVYLPLAVAGVAALRRAVAPRAILAWLVAVSVVFSAASDVRSVLLIVVSTLFNYALGAALLRAGRTRRALRKQQAVRGRVRRSDYGSSEGFRHDEESWSRRSSSTSGLSSPTWNPT